MSDTLKELTKSDLFDELSDFTQFPDEDWFIETTKGNFIWNTDENTLTLFKGSYSDYSELKKIPCGNFDGSYILEHRLGKDFKLVIPK